LEDVVLDPFTNPVELALPSKNDIITRLKQQPGMLEKFRAAFPSKRNVPTLHQVGFALALFVRSLKTETSAYDRAIAKHSSLMPNVERGHELFKGLAGCIECHSATLFADGQFHHSGIGQTVQSRHLSELTQAVIRENLSMDALGPKVLTNSDWSSLGRFAVTKRPLDIGAFRTPSLRNVAATAPYMHDGSVATLSEAVDQEIYYRGLSKGHPINLSSAERQAIVAFLESLTDETYVNRVK